MLENNIQLGIFNLFNFKSTISPMRQQTFRTLTNGIMIFDRPEGGSISPLTLNIPYFLSPTLSFSQTASPLFKGLFSSATVTKVIQDLKQLNNQYWSKYCNNITRQFTMYTSCMYTCIHQTSNYILNLYLSFILLYM